MNNTDTLKNKFRFFYINFGFFSDKSADTAEEAKILAKKGGFECNVLYNGELVASWSPIGGFRYYNRELFGLLPALKVG